MSSYRSKRFAAYGPFRHPQDTYWQDSYQVCKDDPNKFFFSKNCNDREKSNLVDQINYWAAYKKKWSPEHFIDEFIAYFNTTNDPKMKPKVEQILRNDKLTVTQALMAIPNDYIIKYSDPNNPFWKESVALTLVSPTASGTVSATVSSPQNSPTVISPPWQTCREMAQSGQLQNLLQDEFEFPRSPDQVFAFGDIHGDADALLVCLVELARVAKPISMDPKYKYQWPNYQWIGGNNIVIQTGDILDPVRGDVYRTLSPKDEFFCIQVLNHLNNQAMKQGSGRVIKLFGNHEAGNLNEQYFRGMTQYMPVSSNPRMRYSRMIPRGDVHEALFGCGARSIAKIGPWVFAHGNVSTEILQMQIKFGGYPSDDPELDYLDTSNQDPSQASFFSRVNRATRDLRHTSSSFENFGLFYDDQKSLLWDRRNSNASVTPDCKQISTVLNQLSARYLVLGHSMQTERQNDVNNPAGPYVHRHIIEQDSTRIILGWDPNAARNANSKFGITLFCPQNLNNGDFSLYLIDVGMSRAFDYSEDFRSPFKNAILMARRPQVLAIRQTPNEVEKFQTFTIISTHDLPRPGI